MEASATEQWQCNATTHADAHDPLPQPLATHRDVLLRVHQVRVEHVRGPDDAAALVGGGVAEAGGGAGGAADQAMQVGALLVRAASLNSVALRALGLEDLGTLWGANAARASARAVSALRDNRLRGKRAAARHHRASPHAGGKPARRTKLTFLADMVTIGSRGV